MKITVYVPAASHVMPAITVVNMFSGASHSGGSATPSASSTELASPSGSSMNPHRMAITSPGTRLGKNTTARTNFLPTMSCRSMVSTKEMRKTAPPTPKRIFIVFTNDWPKTGSAIISV
ncbi:hypothetical protein ACFQGX_25905 [Nonomuraea dietziae]|uniref:hypothetical protein n=1 Tax=Nonomuraea dietziae TaxID=65515 RepID=UPI003612B3E7